VPFLLKQLDEAFLLRDEGIDGGGLAVEERRDPNLLVPPRVNEEALSESLTVDLRHSYPIRFEERVLGEAVAQHRVK
jgi:hypothetical protein